MKIDREKIYWQEEKPDCEFLWKSVRGIPLLSYVQYMKLIYWKKEDLKRPRPLN